MRRRSGFGWLELFTGILLIALGAWVFVNPGHALTSMVFAYGIAAVIMGVLDIVLYVQVERYTGFGPVVSLISGILSVMSGMLLLLYPQAGALVLTLLFPIWFIAHCIARLAHLPYVRLEAGNGIFYYGLVTNIIGLILGFMMLLKPLFTLTVIRYFAGIYLILLGIDSIVMAFSPMGRNN
ncbi:MAG TPA: DUF308 domain-containing protein [Candidatus Excrementavichristensenella intestinipullorum]|nr:DUF308 domain-containing protein [Candidatus Excrementavichristensenella intestinipullorum]